MKLWMKALVWLGLGGGIGFFAGYQVGYKRAESNLQEIRERVNEGFKHISELSEEAEMIYKNDKHRLEEQHQKEMAELRRQYEDALEAQRKYLGGKDDQIISEGQIEMNMDEDADEDVMDEDLNIDDLDSGYYGDTDGDDIPAFHPEDLRPFAISASEYLQNDKGYDCVQLDYYTEDCVIFDPLREEKWTHPEQLLGLGWKALFISSGKSVREAYVQNDTMECLYKITRIDDSFERLYEEE